MACVFRVFARPEAPYASHSPAEALRSSRVVPGPRAVAQKPAALQAAVIGM